MGRDKSMTYWTREKLDQRAQRDAKDENYNPPYSWIPFTWERPGTEARDTYDRAYEYHRSHNDDDED